jgi:hypothetical protein
VNETLDTIKAWLALKLDEVLVLLEAEKGVVIPRLAGMDTAEDNSRQYPFLEILPDTSDVLYIHPEASMDNEAWDVHSIAMLFTMSGGETPKEVQYSLGWYRTALVRVIKSDNTFGGAFNSVKMGQTQWWPMVKSQQSGELLQTMRQNLRVRVWQGG